MCQPLPLHATLVTPLSCPRRQRSCWPLIASHTRTVLSDDPLTMRRPSPLHATLVTPPSCPRITAFWAVPRLTAGGRNERNHGLPSLAARHRSSNVDNRFSVGDSQGSGPLPVRLDRS